MRFKNLVGYFFLAFVVYNHDIVYAETLLFKSGDKASYVITQTLNSENKIFGQLTDTTSNATIVLDINILDADQQKNGYPFEVEVIVRSISISEIQKEEQNVQTIQYDSTNPSKNLQNDALADYLNQVINHPFIFRIDGEFQVKETTGYLNQICENSDSLFSFSPGVLGATPWSFELLLTQLFHLAGQDLLLENSYPASCHQFLNWEDEALDEKEIDLRQSSHYYVKKVTPEKIKAVWKGKAHVIDQENCLKGDVILKGNVRWNPTNPLIQKRDLTVTIEQNCTQTVFPVQVKMLVKQVWKPILSSSVD